MSEAGKGEPQKESILKLDEEQFKFIKDLANPKKQKWAVILGAIVAILTGLIVTAFQPTITPYIQNLLSLQSNPHIIIQPLLRTQPIPYTANYFRVNGNQSNSYLLTVENTGQAPIPYLFVRVLLSQPLISGGKYYGTLNNSVNNLQVTGEYNGSKSIAVTAQNVLPGQVECFLLQFNQSIAWNPSDPSSFQKSASVYVQRVEAGGHIGSLSFVPEYLNSSQGWLIHCVYQEV